MISPMPIPHPRGQGLFFVTPLTLDRCGMIWYYTKNNKYYSLVSVSVNFYSGELYCYSKHCHCFTDEVEIKFSRDKAWLVNNEYNTEPLVAHGNGNSKVIAKIQII